MNSETDTHMPSLIGLLCLRNEKPRAKQSSLKVPWVRYVPILERDPGDGVRLSLRLSSSFLFSTNYTSLQWASWGRPSAAKAWVEIILLKSPQLPTLEEIVSTNSLIVRALNADTLLPFVHFLYGLPLAPLSVYSTC